MNNLIPAILIFSIAAFVSCGEDEDVIDPPVHEVWMKNNLFFPDSITVEQGTTITWVNKDEEGHTVTAVEGQFDSGIISPGESFQYTFDELGEVVYVCSIHADMRGRVVVIY